MERSSHCHWHCSTWSQPSLFIYINTLISIIFLKFYQFIQLKIILEDISLWVEWKITTKLYLNLCNPQILLLSHNYISNPHKEALVKLYALIYIRIVRCLTDKFHLSVSGPIPVSFPGYLRAFDIEVSFVDFVDIATGLILYLNIWMKPAIKSEYNAFIIRWYDKIAASNESFARCWNSKA